jgi:hypothetical protein
MLLRNGLLLLLTLSCRGCPRTNLQNLTPAQFSAQPTFINFPNAYVGQTVSQSIHVTNSGQTSGAIEVFVDPPFKTQITHLDIPGAASEDLLIQFSPAQIGASTGALKVGSLEILLTGTGLQIPECVASNACKAVSFDVVSLACRENTLANGTGCQDTCLQNATCQNGICSGQSVNCSDSNACTVDTCGPTGCTHALTVCPASTNPCQVPACNSSSGCEFSNADDGVLCGPDVCAAISVNVCINGQCVDRPRPQTQRCTNTWVPAYIPGRQSHAMAYDAARKRTLVFSGNNSNDTWEWNGQTWTQRFPVNAPTARYGHSMVYDSARQRIVLFGGSTTGMGTDLSDTWEWDGSNWLERHPATQPSARASHSMAFDSIRQRTVLFGGFGNGPSGTFLSDTWEYDGVTWTPRISNPSPQPRGLHAMTYDALSARIMLFGGYGAFAQDASTWVWNGMTWQHLTAPHAPNRMVGKLEYDVFQKKVVLVAPEGDLGLWEWSGSDWVPKVVSAPKPIERSSFATAYDSERGQLIVFSGTNGSASLIDTWEFNGVKWAQPNALLVPSARTHQAMAYDSVHQNVVLFGGRDSASGGAFDDTWIWNGTVWEKKNVVGPIARHSHSMAFDATREEVVLFAGQQSGTQGVALQDTWVWNGTTWTQRMPATPPAARLGHTMVADPIGQRILLVSGKTAQSFVPSFWDTWQWNGSQWSEIPLMNLLLPVGHNLPAAAFDSSRGRIVLTEASSRSVGPALNVWESGAGVWQSITTTSKPPPRLEHAMAYDSIRQKVMLFGGSMGQIQGALSDTWEWSGAGWTELHPGQSPPESAGHALVFDAARGRLTLFSGSDTWLYLP